MGNNFGKFIVSLDFELMWGVRDAVTAKSYGDNIRGVHEALPEILKCFTEYGIRGTFATVGFLFFENKNELTKNLPRVKPGYTDKNLSPYGNYIDNETGTNQHNDPLHYGAGLIRQIKNTPGQEIGTHTFSHYYCLEPGQTAEQFRYDLKSATDIAAKNDIKITSIVFPRNQVNRAYLAVCEESGILTYRGTENSWLYSPRNGAGETRVRRAFRLVDSYINLTGHHCLSDREMIDGNLVNIPSGRFLRPVPAHAFLPENLRLNRIKKSMTYAARNNKTYHLWWHPHNFGAEPANNFRFLIKILEHFRMLNRQNNFTSLTMTELAKKITENIQS